MKVRTRTGFEWDVDDGHKDDQELVDLYLEVDENPHRYSKLLSHLLGKDGKKALYDHVRDGSGIVPATRIVEEMGDIIDCMKENPDIKN